MPLLCTRFVPPVPLSCNLFFFNDPAPTEIYTLSLHDALPIWLLRPCRQRPGRRCAAEEGHESSALHSITSSARTRSEEHTSELQSLTNLVCRLLLEKKKKKHY